MRTYEALWMNDQESPLPPLWGYENDINISRENYKWNTYRTLSGSCMSIIGAPKPGYAYNKIGYKPMNCENNLLGNLLTECDVFLTSKWLTLGCLDMDTASPMQMVLWKLQEQPLISCHKVSIFWYRHLVSEFEVWNFCVKKQFETLNTHPAWKEERDLDLCFDTGHLKRGLNGNFTKDISLSRKLSSLWFVVLVCY